MSIVAINARNQFKGKVKEIILGPVVSEVDVETPFGVVTSVITTRSLTDPYLFLLRALHTEGLTKKDIEHVALQHPDGRVALEQKRVDAWAGLDPHTAASELDAGSKLLYRNVNFNTYGFLNTTEAFASKHPEAVERVIKAYERARKWIIANPEETATLVSEEAKISLPVAKLQLTRNDFSNPLPGAEHIKALKIAGPILVEEELVKKGVNIDKVIDELVEPKFARAVIR